MINVSDELKNAVINEEMSKSMNVVVTNVENLQLINWYTTDRSGAYRWQELNLAPNTYYQVSDLFFKFDEEGAIDYDYVQQARFVGVSFDLIIENVDPDSSESFSFLIDFYRNGIDTSVTYGPYYTYDYEERQRFGLRTDTLGFEKFRYFRIINTSQTNNLKCKMTLSKPKLYMFYTKYSLAIPFSDIIANEENIEKYVKIGDFTNSNIVSQGFSYTESICSLEQLKLGLSESSSIELQLFGTKKIPTECDIDVTMHIGEAEDGFEWNNFVIAKSTVENRGGTDVNTIVAYDKISLLNQNAYSWYTKYMWGMNLDSPQPNEQYKFDYCRQMFGALWDILDIYDIVPTFQYDPNHYVIDTFTATDYPTQDRYFNFTTESYVEHKRILFCKKSYTHEVGCDILTVTQNKYPAYGYWNLLDKFYRGVLTNACIYVDLNMSNGEVIRILADSAECIAIPADCETFDVYVPYAFGNNSFQPKSDGIFTTTVVVRQRNNTYFKTDDITNAYRQLPYFSYEYPKPTIDNIVSVSSDITIRDIVRSICEMCGCFFRLDRQGLPVFIYPSEHGLYPSNELFPADDLFPKKSSEMTMPTTYYISAQYSDSIAADFGGVQVLVDTIGSSGGVCRWEYWSVDDNDNSYVIDDNIFLCAEGLVSDPTQTADVLVILENMFGRIGNIRYTPFTAETIGTPFLESGDRFTLLTKTSGFESFIFERKLKGIQALRDHYEARGIAKTPRINNYEWQS